MRMKLASLKKVMAALPDETELRAEVEIAPNTPPGVHVVSFIGIHICLCADEDDLHHVALETEPL